MIDDRKVEIQVIVYRWIEIRAGDPNRANSGRECVVGATKVPSPLPRKSERVLSVLLATMMSSMLSLRTSAVVTKTGSTPVVSAVVGKFPESSLQRLWRFPQGLVKIARGPRESARRQRTSRAFRLRRATEMRRPVRTSESI